MNDRLWNDFAGEWLAKRVAALWKLTTSGKFSDTEYVHDVRVASRRLKEALRVFGASIEPVKAVECKKNITKMLTALGNARDTEVQLEILQEFLGGHTALQKDTGLTRLAADLAKNRRKLDRKARKVIKTFEKTGVLRERICFLRKTACSDEGGAGKPKTSQIHPRITRIVARRMADVKQYGRFAGRPHCQKELHQLRLCIKKLRYTLELFAPLYGGELDKSIETTAALQQALGNMHDRAVWVENLTAGISERMTSKGLRSFYRAQKAAQCRYYTKFLKIWTEAGKRKVWTKTQQTIAENHGNMDEN
jgi:CHAD domain-containing protein